MNLWIPNIRDQFKLLEDWEFPLFLERRNDGLTTRIKPQIGTSTYHQSTQSIGCCLLIGTVLQVDRVYIRQGTSNAWNSITFYIKYAPDDKEKPKYIKQQQRRWTSSSQQENPVTNPTPQKLKGARFWAKLMHVNEIVCEPIAEQDRVK